MSHNVAPRATTHYIYRGDRTAVIDGVPLNIRLSEPELVYILEHSGATLLVATVEFADRARAVAESVGIRVVVGGSADGADEYESLLAQAGAPVRRETDERGCWRSTTPRGRRAVRRA